MEKNKTLTLKDAIKKNKLDQFIKEHEKDAPSNADQFDATLSSMTGKSKAVLKASSQDDSES